MIKVYNTLTGKKEEFVPFEDKKVKMYVCGLTVQNYSHVGHIRSVINYDVIRRYLEYRGYDVYCIQNFTDINQKIVDRAREEGMKTLELAKKYTIAYLQDIDNLNVKRADAYCTATENIEKIKQFVQKLLDKDFAYEVNGNVYFSVEKYSDYGKLSGRKLEDMDAGSRVAVNKEKKHPLDFALWKKVEDNKLLAWESPWSRGWPGWHIECSVMSMKLLGNRIDIHGGGTDLIFPHHENEIAQSEACTGESPFVKYWLHNGTVDIKGEKMSKSLGNFLTTRELLDKFSADEIRYFLLTKHYHSPIDFSLDGIKNTAISFEKLLNTRYEIRNIANKLPQGNIEFEESTGLLEKIETSKTSFEQAMDDDFNTARAIGVMHNMASDINSFINSDKFKYTEESQLVLNKAEQLFETIFSIMGFASQEKVVEKKQITDSLVNYILNLREEARAEQNFALADKIRDDLQEMGLQIKDTAHGPVWKLVEEEQHGS